MIYNATVYISSNSEHTVELYGPAWRDLMLRWVDSAPPPSFHRNARLGPRALQGYSRWRTCFT